MDSLLNSSLVQTPLFSSSSKSQTYPTFTTHHIKPPLYFKIKSMPASHETVAKAKEDKLWGGRFKESVTNVVEKFSESVSYDKELYKQDIMGSRAHASMLAHHMSLVKLALKNEGLTVPGYTHLQRAQPLLLQHLLLSYVEQLERDIGRFLDCKNRLNYCPLGACALAGTGLPIDRFMTSKALGFTEPLRNSVDAVSDRDFVIEFLSANAITAIHLSRLAEEWVLWATEEFGFLTPNDSVSTGSSIMPQKKNPDPMELVRGKSARIIGSVSTLMVLCKGLPSAYNRDLQEDKEPLFDSVKTITGMLEVTSEFAQNITFNRERIQKSLPAGHLDATTVADYLVNKGVPFRTSHDIVGRCVALCVAKICELKDLTLDELRSISPTFDEDVFDYLGVENSVKKFRSYGSTGAACVEEQVNFWVSKLGM